MNSQQHSVPDLSTLTPDPVNYTLTSLGRHMRQCQRAQGPWFGVQSKAELARALVSSRLVTVGAVAVLCCWALMSLA